MKADLDTYNTFVTTTTTAWQALLRAPTHRDEFRNVVFLDAHVEMVSVQEYDIGGEYHSGSRPFWGFNFRNN
ncbi:hypothetical protein ACERK3_11730 [Phycisphaerales bacterium AB-hyl4]|uniref:Uncharacterized protein n=1 Tax=Natronomicrosphaera hydrolytica TaxID=3242702 RepID=A0ABV4U5T9_9BACT